MEIQEWLKEEHSEIPNLSTIEDTELALLKFAEAHSEAPPGFLRTQILSKLSELKSQTEEHKKLDLNRLPFLSDNHNLFDWQRAVDGIVPPPDFEDIHLHTIESSENRELFVAWVKEFVPEEVHHDLLESFLILEGSCECHITNPKGETRIIRLGQGDFYTMQVEETHDIIITSAKPAKAIIEWRKLAA